MKAVVMMLLTAILVWQGSAATLIVLKVQLGQHLIKLAWYEGLSRGESVKPWFWADITATGRLRVPELALEQVLLKGHSGEALAFGPGLISRDSGGGLYHVVSGHRDTHFAALEQLKPGMLVYLDVINHTGQAYRIRQIDIVDSKNASLRVLDDRLVLTTCYPFDSKQAGSLRLVAIADPVDIHSVEAD